jgi:hypothetical protein
MLDQLRSRLTYANVVATLALFLAVGGGTAFAVVAANQVDSNSIINGQVKKPDIGANSVGTGKVIDNSLKGADIDEATLVQVGAGAVFGGDTNKSTILPGGARFGAAAESSEASADLSASSFSVAPARAMAGRDLAATLVGQVAPAGVALKFSLMVGAKTTALSCTIPSGKTSCTPPDTSHSVAVGAGQPLRMKIENVGTSSFNANGQTWSWRLVTP